MPQQPHVAATGTHDDRPSPAFTVTVRADGDADGIAVVVVRGELDLVTQGELRRALGAVLAGPVRGVEVDLSGVTFCDCSGLNTLLAARLKAHEHPATLTVRAASPAVRRILELTGTLPLFSPGTGPGGAAETLSSVGAADAADVADVTDAADVADVADMADASDVPEVCRTRNHERPGRARYTRHHGPTPGLWRRAARALAALPAQ